MLDQAKLRAELIAGLMRAKQEAKEAEGPIKGPFDPRWRGSNSPFVLVHEHRRQGPRVETDYNPFSHERMWGR